MKTHSMYTLTTRLIAARVCGAFLLASGAAHAGGEMPEPRVSSWQETRYQLTSFWERSRDKVAQTFGDVEQGVEDAQEIYRDWKGDWPPQRRLERPMQYLNNLHVRMTARLKDLDDARRALRGAYDRAGADQQAIACVSDAAVNDRAAKGVAEIILERYNRVQVAYGRVSEAKRMIPVWISMIKSNEMLEGIDVIFGNTEIVLADTGRLLDERYVIRSPEALLSEIEGLGVI